MTNWQPIEYDDIRKGDRYRTILHHWRGADAKSSDRSEGRITYEVDLDSRAPDIPVGTAGTVFAYDQKVRGIKIRDGYLIAEWGNSDWGRLFDGDVTDFVPDEILTDERVEQIRAEERERIAQLTEACLDPASFADTAERHLYVAWVRDGAK